MNRLLIAAFLPCLASVVASASDRELAAVYGRGAYQLRAGQVGEALATLDHAVEQGSRDPRVFYYRGLAYAQLGAEDQASIDYHTAAALERTRYGSGFDVGRALEPIQGYVRGELEEVRREVRVASVAEVRDMLATGLASRDSRDVAPPATPNPSDDAPPPTALTDDAPSPSVVEDGPRQAGFDEPSFPEDADSAFAAPDATADELLFPEPEDYEAETDPIDDLLNQPQEQSPDDFLDGFPEPSAPAAPDDFFPLEDDSANNPLVDGYGREPAESAPATPDDFSPSEDDSATNPLVDGFGLEPAESAPATPDDFSSSGDDSAANPLVDGFGIEPPTTEEEDRPAVSSSVFGSIFNRAFVAPVAEAASDAAEQLQDNLPLGGGQNMGQADDGFGPDSNAGLGSDPGFDDFESEEDAGIDDLFFSEDEAPPAEENAAEDSGDFFPLDDSAAPAAPPASDFDEPVAPDAPVPDDFDAPAPPTEEDNLDDLFGDF